MAQSDCVLLQLAVSLRAVGWTNRSEFSKMRNYTGVSAENRPLRDVMTEWKRLRYIAQVNCCGRVETVLRTGRAGDGLDS